MRLKLLLETLPLQNNLVCVRSCLKLQSSNEMRSRNILDYKHFSRVKDQYVINSFFFFFDFFRFPVLTTQSKVRVPLIGKSHVILSLVISFLTRLLYSINIIIIF